MYRLDGFSKLPWEKKADGRFWTHITLGEVGKELNYFSRDRDGKVSKRVEVATDEGLFNDESVKSLSGLPIVIRHPSEKKYQLNKEGLRVGTILSTIGREDDKLIAEAIIDDSRGVSLIEELLRKGEVPEASSGYLLRELRSRSDGKYEQIRGAYDHVAAPLIPGMGRGGQDLVMRFDSSDGVSDVKYFDFGRTKTVDLIVRIDGKDKILKDVSEDVERAIADLQSRLDEAILDLEGVEEKVIELQEEKDKLEGQLAARTDSKVDVSEEIKSRMDAWDEVRAIAPNIKLDYSLEPSQIKRLAIKEINPNLNLDGKSNAYIEGIWEGLKINSQPQKRQTDNYLEEPRADNNGEKSRTAIAYEQAYKNRKRG